MKDENQIARYILWQALRHHGATEKLWAIEFRKTWRAAAGAVNRMPRPRARLKPRLPLPPMTPEELARVGSIDGLLG